MSVILYKATGLDAYDGTDYWFSTTTTGSKAINANVWAHLNKYVVRPSSGYAYVGVLFSDLSTSKTPPNAYDTAWVIATTPYSSSPTSFASIADGGPLYKNGSSATRYFTVPTATTTHTRTFTAGNGGRLIFESGYGYEFIGTDEATPSASGGYEFVEWRNVSDDSRVVPVTGLTISATTHEITISASYAQDVDVYAYFRPTTVALNCSKSGNGTLGLRVDGVLQSAITGLTFDRDVIHTIRLTNTADYGYKFYWYGITPSQDGVASATTYVTSEDYTFYTETDGPDLYTVVAYFVVRPTAHLDAAKVNPTYGTIKLTLSDATVINESANVISEDVYEGYEHTLLATVSDPATNYFVGWFTESAATNLVSAAASYAFTPDSEDVTNGITLYAVFREKADISVTTEIQLDDIPEASEFDGNVFETYTSAPLKAGDVQFTLSANTSHYWGNPDITASEITKGGSSAFNSVTYHAADDDYTIDENGRVTLSLTPLQTWTEGEDPIAYTVSANFPSESVGETVIRGANAGTYAWMYPYQFTNWKDRNNATPPDPGRPENPHYGDTGTLTISPIDSAKIKIGHITVKYGDVVAKDEDTSVSNEDSYVLPVTVTGPLTVTVSMKATVAVSAGSGTIPESIAFTINGIEEADKTASLIVGTPCSVDFTGTDEATVFDGWTASGWQTYTSGTPPAMVPKYAQSSTRPYTFTLVGNTVFVPSFVEADEFPFVAVQFFDATANAVFVQGGSNPTATQTGGTPTTRAAMRAQIGGLSEGNFDDAFADNASVMYLSLASLASLELTAAGTASQPFLCFEKAAIA